MEIVLIAAASVFIGVGGSLLLLHFGSKKGRKTKKQKTETTKKVVWVCLINGFAWVWCSYILAYLDKPQIAESLSQVAVTEIIGVVLSYCIKSAVENLSKNNRWPDKDRPAEEHTDSGSG
jgi:uncharacterized membrane protein|uniref:Uncharacterized protein n=1 Tax=Siphoviridae sp. ctjfQ5 TaxID=2823594 RepID=A0A8S5L8H1_9CAUD|nr:MAG TPA: hypothetical protein [Siphoviridae sp. ctjfQ5]